MAWVPSIPERVPSVVAGYSMNMNATGTLSHTFTEGGKYQYLYHYRVGSPPYPNDPTINLNGIELTPTRTTYLTPYDVYFYGEITVSANDVLSVVSGSTSGNTGLQLFLFQNTNWNLFNVLGVTINDNTNFALPRNKWVFELYKCGYYGNNNNFSYRIEKYEVRNDSNSDNYALSIPTPSGDSRYYYGFTIAITI